LEVSTDVSSSWDSKAVEVARLECRYNETECQSKKAVAGEEEEVRSAMAELEAVRSAKAATLQALEAERRRIGGAHGDQDAVEVSLGMKDVGGEEEVNERRRRPVASKEDPIHRLEKNNLLGGSLEDRLEKARLEQGVTNEEALPPPVTEIERKVEEVAPITRQLLLRRQQQVVRIKNSHIETPLSTSINTSLAIGNEPKITKKQKKAEDEARRREIEEDLREIMQDAQQICNNYEASVTEKVNVEFSVSMERSSRDFMAIRERREKLEMRAAGLF